VDGWTPNDVRNRWLDQFDPVMKQEAWSPVEEKVLVTACGGHHLWTKEQDKKVVEHVRCFGAKAWEVLAVHLPGRSAQAARVRWLNHLDPNIDKREWTPEEDKVLIEAHARLGKRWTEIAALLPGRTNCHIINRWRHRSFDQHREVCQT
jgi:hypothetical protein